MLSKRHRKIIELILSSKNGIKNQVLSEKIEISPRTIRNDIKEINESLETKGLKIDSSSKLGYYIGENLRKKFQIEIQTEIESTKSFTPSTPSDRVLFIILKLIWDDTYCTFDNLANLLFVSKTTISYDVKKIKQLIDAIPHLTLIISPIMGIKIEGIESSKRLLIFAIIRQSYSNNLTVFKSTLSMFTINLDNDFFIIYNEFVLYFDENNMALTDKGLNLLVLEVLISIHRIRDQHLIEPEFSYDRENYESKSLESISKQCHIRFNQDELNFFHECLQRKRLLSYNPDCQPAISKEASVITTKFITVLFNEYHIDLSKDSEFIQNLSIHISCMIYRLKNYYDEENSIVDEIKSTYSFAFELSTIIAPIIQTVTDLHMSDTEIAYIAIHLAVVLDKHTLKKNIAIVCGSGLGTAQLLMNRLNSFFANKINIVGCIPIYQFDHLKNRKDIDLIITTIPIHFESDVPIIQISPLFSQQDINELNNVLQKISVSLPMNDTKKVLLRHILGKPLFHVYHDEIDELSVLEEMTTLLVKQKYTPSFSMFLLSVLKRERLYSTHYDLIWLPHPMCGMSTKTTAAVSIINTPSLKKIVFLLAINPKEIDSFQILYNKIGNLMDQAEMIQHCLSLTSFEEFIECFENV